LTLPIDAVLPDICAALRNGPNLVIVAPPGAGKTTAVAPALLHEDWCPGEILLLSPRRIAARAAAERMASLAGERVGETIGYATRMDVRRSVRTRIFVVTEGIFRARIQAEPDLPGVSAVLFDEVHERSLDSDAGLAFALDAQAAFRPDLRIVAMSATLDGARFSTLLDAPIIESEGKAWPLEIRHIGRKSAKIEDDMTAAIRRVLCEEAEDVLAFLPGVAEIERTAERLNLNDIAVHKLHGTLDPAAQRAALAPSATRKVILATSIAETSLTIDGVRIVIDSGLARRPRYDRGAGMTRLVTERASQAAVTQRAGRAARQGPGVAYRLWEEAATVGLPKFDPPEILEADLSALLLDCAIWGATDPLTLKWVDPPPEAALREAQTRLIALSAIDADGRPTPHGKAIAALPLPPRLAHMLLLANDKHRAAEIAMLLSERGLGGTDADLETRLVRWRSDKSARAEAARRTAMGWIRLVKGSPNDSVHQSPGALVALAFPDRVAKRRSSGGADWISVGGRGFRLDPTSPLARHEWLAVAETAGSAAGARVLSAAEITLDEIITLFADKMEARSTVNFEPEIGGVSAVRETRLGAIRIASGPDSNVDPGAITQALLDGVLTYGLSVLPWHDGATSLRTRARYAGIDALSDAALMEALDDWLTPLLIGMRRLDRLPPAALADALCNRLSWDERRTLDTLAPANFTSPAGTTHPIDYDAEAGPTVTLRVQALFGLARHPTIGSGEPLILSLTSPAGRPIQTTRDLPGFWAGSWRDVVKDMRGRYPRHNWPDDPTAAIASLKTKNALAKGR
jgi:ATP-dependent helicase HrpB